MWKCKCCGEEVVAIETRAYSNSRRVKKNGGLGVITYKDKVGEGYNTTYSCVGCFENSEELEEIAEWVVD